MIILIIIMIIIVILESSTSLDPQPSTSLVGLLSSKKSSQGAQLLLVPAFSFVGKW